MIVGFSYFPGKRGANMMAQWEKELADKPDSLRLRPSLGPTWYGERIDSAKLFSDLHMYAVMHPQTPTNKQINKNNKMQYRL